MKKCLTAILVFCLITAVVLFSSCGNKNGTSEKVNVFDYINNVELLATPQMFSDGFHLEIQNADSRVETDGIGRAATIQNSAEGQERMARAEEWGYSITNLDGITDGMGREIHSTIKGDNVPENREQAVESLKEYLDTQYKQKSLSGVYYSMNGHFPWHHYAGEAGFDVLGSEIGENINNYQWHIALNRGAARQYQTPWFVDFSMWNSGTILDYSATPNWEGCSSVTGGHSLSLFERSMLMSYMSGADSVVAEAGSQIAYLDDGTISPYGETCKKINTFASDNADVGTSYTPFAIVLDYYHGTYSGVTEKLSFDTFKYNKGDKMTDSLINMLWPDGIQRKGDSENGLLINNGYGDVFDVLLQNAGADVLSSYPCLILSGNISLSDAEVTKYKQYVQNGGTIVINSAYINYFDDWKSNYKYPQSEFSYGNGTVIAYGKDYSVKELDSIIKKLTAKYIPFTFSNDIEYLVNVKEKSILLTLINNNGIDKKANETPVVKSGKGLTTIVNFNGTQTIDGVNMIYGDGEFTQNGNSLTIIINPGEAVVLEYNFK